MNNGFWDLDAEERGHWYDKAEEETGRSFWDLSAEERGYYYDRAGGDEGRSRYDEDGYW